MGLLDYNDQEQSIKRTENRKKIESQANRLLKKKKTRRGKKKKLKRPSLKGIPKMSYQAYIKSGYWRKRKAKFFKKYGKYCVICGSRKIINLHHKTYKYKFGAEPDNALVALCSFHHKDFHDGYKVSKDMTKDTNEYIKVAKATFKQSQETNLDDLSWI